MKCLQSSLDIKAPIIICDDHIAIRAGVMKILEEQGITAVSECNTVAVLLDLVRQYPNSIVITDLAIDETPLPTLIAQLRNQSANCQIVVYSMREAPSTIGLCYEEGVAAFVPKSAEPEEIVKAIEAANRGERYFPAAVASELANFHVDRRAPSNVLSPREMAVFIGYAKEETVEILATKLGISERTVNNLLSLIAKKLDVPRSAFHHVARRYGLLDVL